MQSPFNDAPETAGRLRNETTSYNFLAGGGEMGERIRAKDWSKTPLGPIEEWPQSLQTIVRIMLTSRQPIWIGWGPQLIKLYNDPYKSIVGGKHPEALGQPASVVWRDIWHDIEPMLQQVMEKDEGTYVESQLLIMERYGYAEETYYTFSYNPVPSITGGVGGMICTNTDDTRRVIGERQLNLLRTLTAETVDARTIADACRIAARSLEQNLTDLPFAMIYLLDPATNEVYLAGTSNIEPTHPAVPARINLDAESVWPFNEVSKSGAPVVVENLADHFSDLPQGTWQRQPEQAVAVPIAPSGETGQAGVLVIGLNPHRKLDEGYQGFINLVAGQIASSIANAQTYEEERKRAEALAEIDRAKTLFFSNVSHEFRTPLTLMLGPIEDTLAEKDKLSEEQFQRAEILHRNALRLLRLVNALLEFSRIEAGRVKAVYEATDLAAFTTDLASSFRSAIEKAGMELSIDTASAVRPVYVDREMWEKIVLNLLSNAFKYTLHGGISVSLQETDGAVELAVTDSGAGIPEKELPHLFERFHRVEGVEGRTIEGTGIGLALVQELVKLHGGTIAVKSEVGQGSSFTVSVPLGQAHLPQKQISQNSSLTSTVSGMNAFAEEAMRWLPGYEAENAEIELEPAAEAETKLDEKPSGQELLVKPYILLADDNADMRQYVRRLLSQRYAVESVSDGLAALAAVHKRRPDLILTDVMMPNLDGFGLLKALRDNEETRTIPVIMLSARAGEEASVEGIEAGADDYLTKPFGARELLARVGTHLELALVRKEAEERFRTLADNISQLAWMADETGFIYWFNQRWYEYTGEPLAEVEGRGWQKLLHPDDARRVTDKLSQHFESGEAWEDTFTLRGKDGEYRWFLSRAIPLRNKSGQIFRWFGTNTDITERRELEQRRDEFIGIASHELKTPLTSIKGYTQLLERIIKDSGNERANLYLAKTSTYINRLNNLIADLLDVSRIQAGKLDFNISEFDFDDLVKEAVESVQPTTNHAVELIGSAGITVTGDRNRLEQVITNLLTNAVKYSPQANRVIVTVQKIGPDVEVAVQDFGIGIAKEKQPNIFDRFYRVDSSAKGFSGLGIGLYISSEIVKRHNGELGVESDEGQGSTFTFSVPIRPE